jgi:ABC-2 type transport system ATP-binding protein
MISLSEVSFSYEKINILDEASFEWRPGQLNLLLGRNGAGKSTFLRIICNLLKVYQGDISWFDSKSVDFNNLIALVESPQIPMVQTPKEFLKEQLSFYKNSDIDSVSKTLKEWGVPVNKKLGKLSQGNVQKVQILRCLLAGCPYVVLDEPTAHLDPFQIQFFWKKIREFQKKGISFLISSHHLSEMFIPKSQVYLLHQGQLDMVKPNKPWRWRLLFKNIEKDHYCDEEFFHGTMDECNQFVKDSIDQGRQLLQMVAADWDIPSDDDDDDLIGDELI